MEYAKESKTVLRLRRKLKKRLREESKSIKKRVLKKITQIIRLRFSKHLLDIHTVNTLEGRFEMLPSERVVQKLRATIIRESERLSSVTKKTLKS